MVVCQPFFFASPLVKFFFNNIFFFFLNNKTRVDFPDLVLLPTQSRVIFSLDEDLSIFARLFLVSSAQKRCLNVTNIPFLFLLVSLVTILLGEFSPAVIELELSLWGDFYILFFLLNEFSEENFFASFYVGNIYGFISDELLTRQGNHSSFKFLKKKYFISYKTIANVFLHLVKSVY